VSFYCLLPYFDCFGFHCSELLLLLFLCCTGEEREPEPKKEPELIVRDDSWRKNAPVREWDKHKTPIFGEFIILMYVINGLI